MPKKIILCADDFGLNASCSRGILKLLHLKRLSAVSCMVNPPDFKVHAKELLHFKNQIQLGLHFNLTEGYFLSEPDRPCFSLNQLLFKTHLRLIKPALIAQEFHAQLDEYVHVMGQEPDFIDGHQHVHQFPVVRSVLLDVYEQRLRKKRTFIRATFPAITLPKYHFKVKMLAFLGGKILHSQLKKLEISHNSYFAGVYDFAEGADYGALFKQWLREAPSNTLIMCHPGEGDDILDVISTSRKYELNYLSSDVFLEDCRNVDIIHSCRT